MQRSFLEGLVHGTTHLCQGQEAVSVGCGSTLDEDDFVSYTYRGHGHCIARGMAMEGAFAELFGRSTGVCGGLGGSMHLQDIDKGLIGSFGIVGAGLPVATGAGVTAQMNKRGQVAMTFFGDGACNIGAFHESLNIAQVWKLPVVYVCENNLYGEFTRINFTTPYEDLYRRAAGYDMEAMIVDGNDVEAVYAAAAPAVARARDGGGPTFIECKTYRHRGHSRPIRPSTARRKRSTPGSSAIRSPTTAPSWSRAASFAPRRFFGDNVRAVVVAADAAAAPWPSSDAFRAAISPAKTVVGRGLWRWPPSPEIAIPSRPSAKWQPGRPSSLVVQRFAPPGAPRDRGSSSSALPPPHPPLTLQ